jgi:hypothetical protein
VSFSGVMVAIVDETRVSMTPRRLPIRRGNRARNPLACTQSSALSRNRRGLAWGGAAGASPRRWPATAGRLVSLLLRAIALLEWLRGNDIQFSQRRQADVDQWLLTGPPRLRREIADFLGWTAARKLTPPLTLRMLPTAKDLPSASRTAGGSPSGCCTTPTSPPSIGSPAASRCSTANSCPGPRR